MSSMRSASSKTRYDTCRATAVSAGFASRMCRDGAAAPPGGAGGPSRGSDPIRASAAVSAARPESE